MPIFEQLLQPKNYSVIFCLLFLTCTNISFESTNEDDTIPKIILAQTADTVSVGEQYTPVFTVSDDKDDSTYLKDHITIWVEDKNGNEVNINLFTNEKGVYSVFLYTVDSDDNKSNTVKITVFVTDEDIKPPLLTLLGPVPYFVVNIGDDYKEPGAIAIDNVDGDISDKITIKGEVNTGTEKECTISYTVKDNAGNSARKERIVKVQKSTGSDTEKPEITLRGNNPVVLHVGESYLEPGAIAKDNVDGNISYKIELFDVVDTARSGSYPVYYFVADNAGNVAYAIRSVIVTDIVDNTPPVITLKGENPFYLDLHEEYVEPGVTAIDNVDGDISANITMEDNVDVDNNGNYQVTYTVSDASGNSAEKVRIVRVGIIDSIPPQVFLFGPNPMQVDYKSIFNDPGAYAVDNVDDTIPFKEFTIDNNINFNSLGTYTVTYRVKDKAGNQASADRQVEVVDTIAPKITIHGDNPMLVELNTSYKEKGARAVDNFDGDVTDKLDTLGEVNIAVEGTYEITYKVTDSHNNTGRAVRTVQVKLDLWPPNIVLRGDNPMAITKGKTFTDPGAFALDNIDDSIPFSEFTVTDNIDINTLGSYTVNYSVTDNAGNSAAATRTVDVLDSIIHYTDTFSLAMRTLDKQKDSGEDGGKVGGEPRGDFQNTSFETLLYHPLQELNKMTITKVLLIISVSNVDFFSKDKTATLYEQDAGPYSPDAKYSTYPNTAWTKELGTITAGENGDYEISGQKLKELVQSWADGTDNEGMVIGGSFTSTMAFWILDKGEIIVEWVQP